MEVAKQLNKKNENCFTDEMIEDYTKRMEVPQLKSTSNSILDRWDVPLF